ncbi:MAG: molybdenum cofactor guanylyltransferase [Aeriscardovia sp.]|nr:molybdenum cofactor guanylyltransferase [uncultured Butyrivibrio sp.]MBR4414835.1 molybdenum cofactor guanylyltransferase [Aeriscardovia sp.]MBR4816390.1 molybdenum cofactor guanylyltransferase [Lachnospiraceae bacterium]
MNEFDGIVLAGGKSKRMGTDKSEIILDGKSFLQIQTEKLRDLGASRVYVSGKSSPIPYTHHVMDVIPDMGPLGGLYSCFLECTCSNALVISVDIPLISQKTLDCLLRMHFSGNTDATVLSHNGKDEPLIAVYRTGSTDILKELLDEKKLAVRALLERLDCQYYDFHGDPNELLNCNSPEDYAVIKDAKA